MRLSLLLSPLAERDYGIYGIYGAACSLSAAAHDRQLGTHRRTWREQPVNTPVSCASSARSS